jgi:transcriptional regulator with XRE-family HTH domain
MLSALADYAHDLVSLFYPNLCQACGQTLRRGEEVICAECQYALPQTHYHEERNNAIEKHFWGRVEIFRASSFYFFQKGSRIQHLIHQLKYRGKTEVGVKLGSMYGNDLCKQEDYHSAKVILPVPLHRSKEMQRGYNQVRVFPFSTHENVIKIPVRSYPFDPKTIGEHLRKRRIDSKLTQPEIGKIIGTSASIVSSWELNHRTPQIQYMPKIIRFLGYNPIKSVVGSLPERIRIYRISKGLSRKKFGELCGVDTSTIFHWEHGMKPRKNLLKKVECVLSAKLASSF